MELEAELEYSAQPALISGTATSGRRSTLSGAAPATVEGSHPGSSAEYIASEIKRHKTGLLVAFGVIVLALAVLGFGIQKYMSRLSAPSAPMKLTGLTSSGKAGFSAISPDGRYVARSEEHTSELQSHHDLVCRLLLEKKKKNY